MSLINGLSVANKPTIICLAGPTAVGKTALTVDLCHAINGEVISADAVQVYRDMNIGSAKPTAEERQGITHHLIDIIAPTERYSAATFVAHAERAIDDILKRGKQPIVSGGTMFYLNALKNGLDSMPVPNEAILNKLQSDLEQLGLEALYQELMQVDPLTAQRLEPSDTQRIMRALAVFRYSSTPISAFYRKNNTSQPFNIKIIALMASNRSVLHNRIEQRFRQMIENGLVEEVEKLLSQYHLKGTEPSLRAVGYRQVVEYLDGKLGFDEMIQNGIAATRQLAKRQLTWIRNSPGIIFLQNPALAPLKSVIDCYKHG